MQGTHVISVHPKTCERRTLWLRDDIYILYSAGKQESQSQKQSDLLGETGLHVLTL